MLRNSHVKHSMAEYLRHAAGSLRSRVRKRTNAGEDSGPDAPSDP